MQSRIELFKESANIKKNTLEFEERIVAEMKENIAENKQNLQNYRFSYPRKVDYKPAESIDEAVEFLRKNFCIQEKNAANLQDANIINEAITHVNNLSNGKRPLFSTIEHEFFPPSKPHHFMMDDETIAQTQSSSMTLWINKLVFNSRTLTPERRKLAIFHELGHLFYKKDMMKQFYLTQLETNIKKLKQHEPYLNKLKEIVKLNEEIIEKSQELLNPPKLNFKQKLILLKNKLTGKKQPDNTEDLFKFNTELPDFQGLFTEIHTKYKCFDTNPNWDSAEKVIARKVSDYAATSYEEFISEAFARLCNGDKLPDDVITLYKKLNGPNLKAFNI